MKAKPNRKERHPTHPISERTFIQRVFPPAKRAALDRQAAVLMEMRWLCESFEERIDCSGGVYAWVAFYIFWGVNCQKLSSAAGSNLVMKQEYKQS